MRHVIASQQFSRDLIEEIFFFADEYAKNPSDNVLEGRIMALLFYEPSTRTRFSFEAAMLRLGGRVMSTENAREFSSAAKGEMLEDTIRVIEQYADVIVLRHFEKGAAKRAAKKARIPIINAGDGPGQHPTQALLDLYTIRKELSRIDGVTVALVGDLKHGRTVRSLAYLLGKYNSIRIVFVSPPELRIGKDILAYLDRHNVYYSETVDLRKAILEADVVYQTRVQKERFHDLSDFEKVNGYYCITPKLVSMMKKGAVILHPLPRVNEITPAVDVFPQAAYFRQAGYGVPVRMGLLKHIFTP
jgi:aspartate carbamoyltransferase catalytic subunit